LSLTIAVFSIQAQTTTQENPFGLDEILSSLRSSKIGLDTTNRILIQKLKNRGVRFSLNEDTEKKLKETGANDNLILEIKYRISQNYFDEAKRCKEVDYDCRINFYNKSIGLLPNDYVGYYNRGIVYNDKEEFDRAIQDYTKALEIDPKVADAYYNRGVAFRNKEDFAKAVEDFNQYLKLNPNDSEIVLRNPIFDFQNQIVVCAGFL
jgi:tetratricopeptide (TPR) repeat protein